MHILVFYSPQARVLVTINNEYSFLFYKVIIIIIIVFILIPMFMV